MLHEGLVEFAEKKSNLSLTNHIPFVDQDAYHPGALRTGTCLFPMPPGIQQRLLDGVLRILTAAHDAARHAKQ